MLRRLIPVPAFALALISTLLLAACAPQRAPLASTPRPLWAMTESDIAIDPAFRTGTLPSGLRFIVRKGSNPAGTALVRMEIAAGSLDEQDDERGYAHFVEHMAFNGSTRVPEGEMVRLLERAGLAFGADTNAQTSFTYTLYTLDLPRTDPALLDTALMLMRETASELTLSPEAVARERGVILAEMRDRNSWGYRAAVDEMGFAHPAARYPARVPIGTTATLEAATSARLRAFWQRHYVPAKTTVIVIGDLDPAAAEAAIRAHFGDWAAAPAPPQPDAGPVNAADRGRTAVYLDPALSERVTASRHGPWFDERDSTAQRRETLLRQIGYDIINRRLQRLARQADAPFRSAGLGTSDVFRAGRTTSLVVDTVDGGWQRGLRAAVAEYRRALTRGFTAAEVAEQVANVHTAHRNAAAAASTRSNGALVGAALALIRDDVVPATPESSLERLEAFLPAITPDAVLAALTRELVPLDDPLLRFAGRRAPQGGAAALRETWREAMAGGLAEADPVALQPFAYTDFGPPGTVVSDTREPALGIRSVRFANGVRLNLKPTTLERGRIWVSLQLDGGDMLATRANPLATDMTLAFAAGGLGRHSQDDLQTVLAGRTVGFDLSSAPETFAAAAQTTPADLALQLQLMTAYLTDPGYRPEGETLYRQTINAFFARKDATPGSALGAALGGILSDDDPRFTLQPVAAYRVLGFAGLKAALADRLAHGAIELAIVGDVAEDEAIGLVARTFGALPAREAEFRPYPEQRERPFTRNLTQRVIRHTGPADQALLRLTWPTRDGDDPVELLQLELLEKVMRIALTDSLREQLGKAYSPAADSDMPRIWRGYGTFAIAASVSLADLPATRTAIRATVEELRRQPVSDDLLLRARQPLLEAFDNALKSNRGWLALVERAQSRPDRIERQLRAAERLKALTAADVMAAARRYLDPAAAIDVAVIAAEVPR
ncbi:M16 family metallopeptidase [Novosphingobium piscinae]|uniref:Insulinase family protein n=1 Tax=Novosphingobium piscinae TaxID=1507448 RepID=A0A7X1KPX3_9SPHN|nr:insulinase family protein [Novosphingobium piscinae]MBC2668908.1 insulinase family protein [Novosphingobium piscinae]